MTNDPKENVIELIKKLPEDATLDDIIYYLYVKKKSLKGINELDQGKTIPHEEVMENTKKRMEEGLK